MIYLPRYLCLALLPVLLACGADVPEPDAGSVDPRSPTFEGAEGVGPSAPGTQSPQGPDTPGMGEAQVTEGDAPEGDAPETDPQTAVPTGAQADEPDTEPAGEQTDEQTTQDHVDIVAWVPSWGSAQWKSGLGGAWASGHNPTDTLSGVAAQFWVTRDDGTVAFDPSATTENLLWVQDYTRRHGMEFILCVHNNDGVAPTDGWNWQLAHAAFGNNREVHIDALIALVDEWDADGIDIDYEGYESGDPHRAAYAEFIRELAARLHAKGKILTLDTLPHIWNQPSASWMEDWVEHVDRVNPMTYDSSAENAYDWNTYRFQQDRALALGYRPEQFMFGMSSADSEWGQGGLGTSVLAHVQENLSGMYNQHPAPVAIWAGMLEADAWRTQEVWDALHALRNAR